MRSLRDLFEERPFAVALLVALVLLLVPYRTLLGPASRRAAISCRTSTR